MTVMVTNSGYQKAMAAHLARASTFVASLAPLGDNS